MLYTMVWGRVPEKVFQAAPGESKDVDSVDDQSNVTVSFAYAKDHIQKRNSVSERVSAPIPPARGNA
eukprot:3168032-Amphidinium_carterae.1